MCNNMDVKLIDGYCGVLKEILLEELRLGNRIIRCSMETGRVQILRRFVWNTHLKHRSDEG